MTDDLPYLRGYSEKIQDQVRDLIRENRLAEYIASRYPDKHDIQTDKALFQYVSDIKQQYLKNASSIDKVLYDNRLDITHQALGLHSFVSRVQAPAAFLRMIVVHELAHLKERQHDKAFFKLCEHMEPGHHQLEFDLRLYLMLCDSTAPLV